MNIKEAKDEIKRTLKAYTGLGKTTAHPIPVSKQRPILMIGPPGIGKTAIMEQIAQECGAGLVSYTMTHHTRQSAIGLPYLRKESFDGNTFQVTEYTMSEIIASVYECIRTTGHRFGILFIDEINCVSETLVPIMLQLLQNKMFGTHRIPEHWMIVAAGNPPEYNRSVREFDMVTLDRVRKMEIEADYTVWREYARENHVHPAILTYLSIHPEYFYSSRLDGAQHSFVTARGWEDLSYLLRSYEDLGEPVCTALISQYLQHEDISHDFALYYSLFRKYNDGYDIPKLLNSAQSSQIRQKYHDCILAASTDERMAVAALMYEYLCTSFSLYFEEKILLEKLTQHCKASDEQDLTEYIRRQREVLKIRSQNHLLSAKDAAMELRALQTFEDTACTSANKNVSETLRLMIDKQQNILMRMTETISHQLDAAYDLLSLKDRQDLGVLHLTTDLSRNEQAAGFLCLHPCRAYLEACKCLLFTDQEDQLKSMAAKLAQTVQKETT